MNLYSRPAGSCRLHHRDTEEDIHHKGTKKTAPGRDALTQTLSLLPERALKGECRGRTECAHSKVVVAASGIGALRRLPHSGHVERGTWNALVEDQRRPLLDLLGVPSNRYYGKP